MALPCCFTHNLLYNTALAIQGWHETISYSHYQYIAFNLVALVCLLEGHLNYILSTLFGSCCWRNMRSSGEGMYTCRAAVHLHVARWHLSNIINDVSWIFWVKLSFQKKSEVKLLLSGCSFCAYRTRMKVCP